jgi:hypothetical protein
LIVQSDPPPALRRGAVFFGPAGHLIPLFFVELTSYTVKFFNPPYAGASHSRTFFYDPDRIAPGGSKVF